MCKIIFSALVDMKGNIKALHHWPFVRGIHRWAVNFPHKGPKMRKACPCYDVIMRQSGILFPSATIAPEMFSDILNDGISENLIEIIDRHINPVLIWRQPCAYRWLTWLYARTSLVAVVTEFTAPVHAVGDWQLKSWYFQCLSLMRGEVDVHIEFNCQICC